ncbi:hypothetical protein SETIT_9G462600v2 [Setaria italica]|uniref:GED domain-containing protein n=1 Tax=Setaria italica TaxID=4555 RepID=A0A368SSX2_SETIT|nr:hypothetical protein SETIT_9G462600v2 [Setaria italica]
MSKKLQMGAKQANAAADTKSATVDSAVTASAIAASYDDQIRPLLDAVDRLRHLKVTQEGIQLPTIVVVGDQSSGKSSGICTRVPLVMRLQDDPFADSPKLQLEYGSGRVVATIEAKVADAINAATVEIVGSGKGISDAPITLVVRKRGGQPEDIYNLVAKIIMEYIAPKESIILNVLSATVDFPTCESIRMSQQVDRTGERTLAVVTKVDKAPEGLLEKVTMDDVNIGLGYVCVCNRIGDETYDQARVKEERLFKYHPLLSKIDKSMVGIPVLAQRLMQTQASIIAKCLPDIVKQINDCLSRSIAELNQMPQDQNNIADAVRVFFHNVKQVCNLLEKVLVRGKFDEYLYEREFHGTTRIAEMLSGCEGHQPPQLPTPISVPGPAQEEGRDDRSGSSRPCQRRLGVRQGPCDELLKRSDNFPQMQSSCRRAVQSLMDKVRVRSAQHVKELIAMELVGDYTANPNYMKAWSKPTKIILEGFGEVDVSHLRVHADLAGKAFDLRARLTAYWKSIVLRLVDGLALHVLLSVKLLVEKDLEEELGNELLANKLAVVEKMLAPSPSTGTKRERLKKSIVLLRQSKEVVANNMDRISAAGEV